MSCEMQISQVNGRGNVEALQCTNLPLFTLWELKHPEECYAVVELPELKEEEQSTVKNAIKRELCSYKKKVPNFYFCISELRFSPRLVLLLFVFKSSE